MPSRLIQTFKGLPSIFGEGALFAFSGLDGETRSDYGLVASLARDPYSLHFHTPLIRTLELKPVQEGKTHIVTGDVLGVEFPSGDLLVAFHAWHTLLGIAPREVNIRLLDEEGHPVPGQHSSRMSHNPETGDCLILEEKEGHFVLAFGFSAEEAKERIEAAWLLDPWLVARDRLSVYHKIPWSSQLTTDENLLLRKCFSVMKVNTMSREGAIHQLWSTPDRFPHQHMWLWDSVFHSLALDRIFPRLSFALLHSVLERQTVEGMIPHRMQTSGASSGITQPPLLAFGIFEGYKRHRERKYLEQAFAPLERYLRWNLEHRTPPNGEAMVWATEPGNLRCPCAESGMDNSPRFETGQPVEALDFTVYQAHDMRYLARIAEVLGEGKRAALWLSRAESMETMVLDNFWDVRTGFFYDRKLDGSLTGIASSAGFLPLLLEGCPPEKTEGLVKALGDPRRFGAPCPVPSLALDHPAFSTDMWRGPAWININYLILRGLKRRGCAKEAEDLERKMAGMVLKHYLRAGVLFEYYDALDQRLPEACDRKGPCPSLYQPRKKISCIRDYHWTAAVTFRLLWDRAEEKA